MNAQYQTTRIGATIGAYLDALVAGRPIDHFLAEDATLTLMDTGEVTEGRDAVIALITYLHQQAFAASPVIRTVATGEDRAMIEADFVGTHIGEFASVAPTGRQVRVPYAVAYDLTGDQIAALRIYLPMDVIVRQIRGA